MWKLVSCQWKCVFKLLHIRIEPRHDYVPSVMVFSPLTHILMLRHHISCFSELQEFAKASYRLLGCVYTVIRVSLMERWKGERVAEASRHTNHSRRIAGVRPLFVQILHKCCKARTCHTFRNQAFVYASICTRDYDYLWPQFPFHSHVVLYLVPNLYIPYLIFIPL
jgi:hypothetical protein